MTRSTESLNGRTQTNYIKLQREFSRVNELRTLASMVKLRQDKGGKATEIYKALRTETWQRIPKRAGCGTGVEQAGAECCNKFIQFQVANVTAPLLWEEVQGISGYFRMLQLQPS